jgi:hypothetical protein
MPSVGELHNYTHVQRFIGGHCEVRSRVYVDNPELILIVICDHWLELGGLHFISIVVIDLSVYY